MLSDSRSWGEAEQTEEGKCPDLGLPARHSDLEWTFTFTCCFLKLESP